MSFISYQMLKQHQTKDESCSQLHILRNLLQLLTIVMMMMMMMMIMMMMMMMSVFSFSNCIICLQTGTIYYFDLRAKTLNKMRTDGTGATVLDRYYTNNVEGIAVDWVGRCALYLVLVVALLLSRAVTLCFVLANLLVSNFTVFNFMSFLNLKMVVERCVCASTIYVLLLM